MINEDVKLLHQIHTEMTNTMKQGDLIEWVYAVNSQPVDKDAELWSEPMQRFVPIGVRPAILVSITDEFYSWWTPDGLFSACRIHGNRRDLVTNDVVVPRTCPRVRCE